MMDELDGQFVCLVSKCLVGAVSEENVDQFELLGLVDESERRGAVQRPVVVVHGCVGSVRALGQQQFEQFRIPLFDGDMDGSFPARLIL